MDKELLTAFMRPSFPCNPIPFLTALIEGVRENGTEWITTNDAKSMLHVVISQSHGQLYMLDAMDEYSTLKRYHDEVRSGNVVQD